MPLQLRQCVSNTTYVPKKVPRAHCKILHLTYRHITTKHETLLHKTPYTAHFHPHRHHTYYKLHICAFFGYQTRSLCSLQQHSAITKSTGHPGFTTLTLHFTLGLLWTRRCILLGSQMKRPFLNSPPCSHASGLEPARGTVVKKMEI